MRSVFKYAVPLDEALVVAMPCGARVLTVQLQHGVPHVWALVDTREELVPRHFAWRGTGHPADGLERYVGTVQNSGGSLVFHLFETLPGTVAAESDVDK